MKNSTLIKDKLRAKLILNGFDNQYISKSFHKSTGREEVTYTLKENEFEIYVRCYPAKEGWTRNKYKYTLNNIKTIVNPH